MFPKLHFIFVLLILFFIGSQLEVASSLGDSRSNQLQTFFANSEPGIVQVSTKKKLQKKISAFIKNYYKYFSNHCKIYKMRKWWKNITGKNKSVETKRIEPQTVPYGKYILVLGLASLTIIVTAYIALKDVLCRISQNLFAETFFRYGSTSRNSGFHIKAITLKDTETSSLPTSSNVLPSSVKVTDNKLIATFIEK